jgi:O-6-methylguanine DNA methyltransferase
MCAVADDTSIMYFNFCEQLDQQLFFKSAQFFGRKIVQQKNIVLDLLEDEMQQYFQGSLQQFVTPINTVGTDFQLKTWKIVQDIAYGTTLSYKQVASVMVQENAARAVGNANGANTILILIPCHRVVLSNGSLGGYAAGIDRKKWLLQHEQMWGV